MQTQALFSLWAQTSASDPVRHHPLGCHLIDVASVSERLWSHVLQPGVKRSLATALGLDVDAAGKWIAFWAGAHDIGKGGDPGPDAPYPLIMVAEPGKYWRHATRYAP